MRSRVLTLPLFAVSGLFAQFVTPTAPLQPLAPATFCGTGIPNGAVATTTINDSGTIIELGLSATERFVNPVVTNNNAGTYFAAIGADVDADPNRARWNFNFFARAQTGVGASALGNYVFELLYDMDPGATPIPQMGVLRLGNTQSPCGASTVANAIQGSQNLGFDYLRTAIPGNPGLTPPAGFQNPGGVDFNPNLPGQYSFLLRVSTPAGVVLGQVAINVSTQGVLIPTPAEAYQIRYFSNLNLGDSVINITNDGANGAGLAAGTTASTTGSVCANLYAFSPDEQLVSCCSCPVTPNGLVSVSARNSLISNTLTPAVPTSIIVKVVGSLPGANGCSNSAASVSPATLARAPGELAGGLHAWGATVKAGIAGGAPAMVETRFLNATLTTAAGAAAENIGELARLTRLCSFIQANGSGFGICRSCQLGGLGAGRL